MERVSTWQTAMIKKCVYYFFKADWTKFPKNLCVVVLLFWCFSSPLAQYLNGRAHAHTQFEAMQEQKLSYVGRRSPVICFKYWWMTKSQFFAKKLSSVLSPQD